jgi:hypothetical protein
LTDHCFGPTMSAMASLSRGGRGGRGSGGGKRKAPAEEQKDNQRKKMTARRGIKIQSVESSLGNGRFLFCLPDIPDKFRIPIQAHTNENHCGQIVHAVVL